MSDDPRCCGSGVCIIDPEGRCWCGQAWDGQSMRFPPLQPVEPTSAPPASAEPPVAAAPHTPPGRQLSAWLLALASACVLLPTALTSPAHAAKPAVTSRIPADDASAIKRVIEAQLAAFAAGDAPGAFAFASRAIRLQFGTADNFMDMVHAGYPMVVRPAAVIFFAPQPVADSSGAILQRVQMRDRAGRQWLALYELVQESAETAPRDSAVRWLIAGCQVRPAAEGQTT
jgi:hypothetical protein